MYKLFVCTIRIGLNHNQMWYFTEEVWRYRFQNHWNKYTVIETSEIDVSKEVYNLVYDFGQYGLNGITIKSIYPDFILG